MVPMKCPEVSYTVTKMWVVQPAGVAIQTLRQQRKCGPTPTEQKIRSAVRQDQIFLSVTGQHTSLELNIAWAQCHINTKQRPSSMTQCPSKQMRWTKQHDAMMQHDAMTQHHDAMAQQYDAMTQQHDTRPHTAQQHDVMLQLDGWNVNIRQCQHQHQGML